MPVRWLVNRFQIDIVQEWLRECLQHCLGRNGVDPLYVPFDSRLLTANSQFTFKPPQVDAAPKCALIAILANALSRVPSLEGGQGYILESPFVVNMAAWNSLEETLEDIILWSDYNNWSHSVDSARWCIINVRYTAQSYHEFLVARWVAMTHVVDVLRYRFSRMEYRV